MQARCWLGNTSQIFNNLVLFQGRTVLPFPCCPGSWCCAITLGIYQAGCKLLQGGAVRTEQGGGITLHQNKAHNFLNVNETNEGNGGPTMSQEK